MTALFLVYKRTEEELHHIDITVDSKKSIQVQTVDLYDCIHVWNPLF